MTSSTLFNIHSRALSLLYAEVERFALQQRQVFTGTAGSVVERTNASGFRFYSHQSYDGLGTRRERYLAGPVGKSEADAVANDLRLRIDELKGHVSSMRLLNREGFAQVDAKTFATLAALHNHGIFIAGGVLIGSHAYGVLLNRLGVGAVPYTTEDVDIARGNPLVFDERPENGWIGILKDSGLDFVEVPAMKRRLPSTSFKVRGRLGLQVDLMVPSAGDTFSTVPVPELEAHAIGLPHLEFLLAESQMAAVMARTGCCAVRVPLPERFAVHKLIVSSSRRGRQAKSEKDIHQACVLLAALAETHPGSIESAVHSIPKRSARLFATALRSVAPILEETSPRAWDELHG